MGHSFLSDLICIRMEKKFVITRKLVEDLRKMAKFFC